AARPGDRPLGQLLEPGAVRQADEPALGSRDRPGPPARGLRAVRHLPPDLPVRVALGPDRRRHAPARRPLLPDPAAGALLSLRRLVPVRPYLGGVGSGRPVAPLPGAADQLLGRPDRAPRRRRRLRLAPVPSVSTTRTDRDEPRPPAKLA